MTKKKPAPTDSNLNLKTRQPGKVNKNFFGDFKARFEENLHPLDEMFPKEKVISSETPNLDTQTEVIDALKQIDLLHSESVNLDAQEKPSGHSNLKTLDTLAPKTTIEAPRKEASLDTQTPREKVSGHSKNANWQKYEKTRSTVRVNLHIDKEIDKKVRQYCLVDATPSIELKQFYERAAIELLKVLDTQSVGKLGALTPLDDRRMMIKSKTTPSIINLYLAYNQIFNSKTKWTIRDDEAAQKFNVVDVRLIELGFIQTHFNKGFRGKINSFQYYVGQIEEIMEIESDENTLKIMLGINRKKWEQYAKTKLDLSFLES